MKLRAAVFAALVLVAGFAHAEDREVNLLSMGDWGRGNAVQRGVAGVMADYVKGTEVKFDAMLTAGDNVYLPLASTADANWGKVFEDMYDRKVLDFPFYIALGNHDYDNPKELASVNKAEVEFAYAREHPESRWKLPAHWYRVDFPADRPVVSVLMLDSNQQKLNKAQWAEELAFIDRELADRRGATWMVACAHHPLFSNGSHGDNGVLQVQWGPLFQKHKLDFYVAGHDHDVQHLQFPDRSTTFLLVGGGGATTRPMRRDNRGPWSESSLGFTHLKFTDEKAVVTFVSGVDGSVLHRIERTPGGEVKVTKRGITSPATTQQLQVIQGVDQRKKKKKDDDD